MLALAVTACTSEAKSSTRLTADSEPLKTSCSVVACSGDLGGAKYQIELPSKWNGTLLIYSHGYRQAHDVPAPLNDTVDTSAQDAPTPEIAKALLAQGYALAGSGYSKEGWATLEGVQAAEDLHGWFVKNVGKPLRVYVYGDSLGGLITEMIAEKHPDWVDGAAPACGALAGTNANLDVALDVAYAVKQLMVPDLKLTGYASFDEAFANYTKALDKLESVSKDSSLAPKIVFVSELVDAPLRSLHYDGQDAASFIGSQVEALANALAYATFDRWELEQRVGGNPSANDQTDYSKRFTPSELTAIKAFGGDPAAYLASLANGQRVSADAAARAKADQLGNLAGDLAVPTVALHTVNDPLVLVQNEQFFRTRVARAGQLAKLAQYYTNIKPSPDPQPSGTDRYGAGHGPDVAPYGAGHCNFTTVERVGQIQLLDRFVRFHEYPLPQDAQAAMPGDKGLDPLYSPPRWPQQPIPTH